MSAEAPCVTLFVLAYRQEGFVREAVAGAFAQDWPNLEIVLSDDASPDGTFAAMQAMAAAYSGPHRVILNRNPQNLGLCAHIDRVVALSSGDFLVQNAGDDVSRPDRARRLAQAWLASGRTAMTVYSAAETVDEAGRPVGRRGPSLSGALLPDPLTPDEVIRGNRIALGATCGWDRRVFDAFDPLGPALKVEDLVTTFRSAALGRVAYVDEELVRWRLGGQSSAEAGGPGREALYGRPLTYARWMAASCRRILGDLDRLPPEMAESCRRAAEARIAAADHTCRLADAGTPGRLAALPGAALRSLRTRQPRWAVEALKYLLDGPYIAYANRRWRPRG